MIMLVDYGTMPIDIKELASRMEALGDEMGLAIRVQHSDISRPCTASEPILDSYGENHV